MNRNSFIPKWFNPKLKSNESLYLEEVERRMPKYTIYQIIHKTMPNCYIGSTKNYSARCALHKNHYNTKDILLYNTMKENGGWDSYEFRVLEEMECETRGEAEEKETEWLRRFEPEMDILNTNKRNDIKDDNPNKWYYKKRSDYISKSKAYYYRNREQILARLKTNRDAR